MNLFFKYFLFFLIPISFYGCRNKIPEIDQSKNPSLIPVILDTDANNELDDQHAIAYMLFNSDVFEIKGITVNETYNGNDISKHIDEANRVVELCKWKDKVEVIPGASGSFQEIVNTINEVGFDGSEAVNFIIETARQTTDSKLVLIPIGKLTNIALALNKAPDIASKVKVVWLGSNWPEKGEYNLDNDPYSVTELLKFTDLEFEIVTVRYGETSGTDAVSVSVEDIRGTMAGLGPKVEPVPGRHGGTFSCFGDYSIELFVKYGDDVRSLYDVCALAILKNPSWAQKLVVNGVSFDGKNWGETSDSLNTVIFWEDFDKDAIIKDFYHTMRKSSFE